jgi:hypothetical protein
MEKMLDQILALAQKLYAVPDKTVKLTEAEKSNVGASTVKLHMPATVEIDLSSPILMQHSQKLLTEVSIAQSESELIDEEEACAIDATGADDGLPVLGACAGIRLPTIDACPEVIGDYAFPAPLRVPVPLQVRKKHGPAVEDRIGGYALPVLHLVPTNRPPPKPGEALRCLAHGSTTTTTRTIKLEACRRGEEGLRRRMTARKGTDSEGGKLTVKGEG